MFFQLYLHGNWDWVKKLFCDWQSYVPHILHYKLIIIFYNWNFLNWNVDDNFQKVFISYFFINFNSYCNILIVRLNLHSTILLLAFVMNENLFFFKNFITNCAYFLLCNFLITILFPSMFLISHFFIMGSFSFLSFRWVLLI